ncbi:HotDog domain-containing protein [Phellopilus nigrolimitatus]|nr:HotDog domain-containing protein [Phellopilus nigrolimitatus]
MAPGESKSNNALSPEEEGEAKLTEMGFDPLSFYEQKVVWGDLDSFRHVNNVRYVRYLESARMHWLQSIGQELGGQERVRDMVAGKGISLILGEISVRFRRPVTYPDTLLIAHRPHEPFPTHFKCAAAVWSNAQRTVVATSDSKLVWYDYDHLKKCDPGAETHAVLARRMRNVD